MGRHTTAMQAVVATCIFAGCARLLGASEGSTVDTSRQRSVQSSPPHRRDVDVAHSASGFVMRITEDPGVCFVDAAYLNYWGFCDWENHHRFQGPDHGLPITHGTARVPWPSECTTESVAEFYYVVTGPHSRCRPRRNVLHAIVPAEVRDVPLTCDYGAAAAIATFRSQTGCSAEVATIALNTGSGYASPFYFVSGCGLGRSGYCTERACSMWATERMAGYDHACRFVRQ